MKKARIIAVYKGLWKVEAQNEQKLLKITGNMHKNGEFPVVGDWVYLNDNEDIINEICERKTKLSRKEAGSRVVEQVLASNIDYVFIVSSLNDDFNIARLERYMTMVYESGASPVFILTKADVGEDIEGKVEELESISFGIPIHIVSIEDDASIEHLRKYFEKENTIGLVGSSGVGKSTLVNKLLGREIIKTASIREDDDKGRHTTTHRELFHLDKGAIIDTPGMRELQLWQGDLSNTFEDIEELAAKCKFSDCSHRNEPGCAVRNAIEIGQISEERYERYQKLNKELRYVENKRTMSAKRAEKQKMIDMMGSLDLRKKIKSR